MSVEHDTASLQVRLELTAAWDNLTAALALTCGCERTSAAGDLWRAPGDSSSQPLPRLLPRLRRGTNDDPALHGYVLAIERVEELLARAGGARAALAPPGLSGIRWQLPDEDGVPRTTIEAAAIVRARALREELDASFPALARCDGPAVVRTPEYDQRSSDAEEPTQDVGDLPDWIESPRAPWRTPMGVTRPHARNVAPAKAGGQPE